MPSVVIDLNQSPISGIITENQSTGEGTRMQPTSHDKRGT
jgi:hypothetical protein